MAIAAILGIAQAGLSIAGGLNKDGPSSAGSVYSNLLSRRKTQLMNQVRLRAYKRQLGRVKEQYKNNFTAANTAYQQEQARFNEQLMEFAFQKESQTRQLLEVAGVSAAGEQQGRSAERAAAIQVLGDYGRGQAVMAENLASAYRQGGRNMARIAGQNMAADMSAYGTILEGPIPEMAMQEYTPPAPQMSGLNMALTIGQGIMSGIKTYGMAGGDFGGAGSETSTPDEAGPNT